MSNTAIPSSFHNLLNRFECCFTKPGFANFIYLASGWITCYRRHRISRVIQAMVPQGRQKHHSLFYRFLSHGRWGVDLIGKGLFDLVLLFLPREITAIVDDTLCCKTGPHIFGAHMFFNACQSSYGKGVASGRHTSLSFGHNWVILSVWVPLPWREGSGIALPILFRLYHSKKRCPTTYRKRSDLAAELVRLLASWLPARRELHVVGDNEYAGKTLVKSLPEKTTFTGPMHPDAALFAVPAGKQHMGRPRKKGIRLPSPSKLKTSPGGWKGLTVQIYGRKVKLLVKSKRCLWYTVAGSQLVRFVITRDPKGLSQDRVFFSTNPELTPSEILVQYSRRWEMEVSFRNCKQVMGIEHPQNGWWRRKHTSPRPQKKPGPNPKGNVGEKAIVHTLALSLFSYGIVVIWYLNHGNHDEDVARARAEAPWYQKKAHPSFNDMVAAARRELWSHRLSATPKLKAISHKILQALPHWLMAA